MLPAEKSVDHKEGSLGFLVNNLVKNWEKEASYKVKGGETQSHEEQHIYIARPFNEFMQQHSLHTCEADCVVLGSKLENHL